MGVLTMTIATLLAQPNDIFDQLWAAVAGLFVPDTTDTTNPDLARFIKANQNLLPTPPGGNYVYMQPLGDEPLNQQTREYTVPPTGSTTGSVTDELHVKQVWQIDCYGPQGDQWAAVIATSWRSMWLLDNWPASPRLITPLYAEQPVLLTIVNAEGVYESRWMVKLHGQINRGVQLPVPFFTAIDGFATPVDTVAPPWFPDTTNG